MKTKQTISKAEWNATINEMCEMLALADKETSLSNLVEHLRKVAEIATETANKIEGNN